MHTSFRFAALGRRAVSPIRISIVGLLAALLTFVAPAPRVAAQGAVASELAPPAALPAAESIKSTVALPAHRLLIHYHEPSGRLGDVSMWTWDATPTSRPGGLEVEPAGRTDYGVYFVVDLDIYGAPGAPDEIGYLPRFAHDWDQKDGTDRTWRAGGADEVFLIRGDPRVYTERPDLMPRLAAAYLESPSEIVALFSLPARLDGLLPDDVTVREAGGTSVTVALVRAEGGAGARQRLRVALTRPIAADGAYTLGVVGFSARGGAADVPVVPRGILSDASIYYDADAAMGANWASDATTFRVFAPTATAAFVVLYDRATGAEGRRDVAFELSSRGVWVRTVEGNLDGAYYTLRFEGPGYDAQAEVVDPYARCVVRSWEGGRIARGMVLDLDRTDPPGWDPSARPPLSSRDNVVIYEVHVRDFTIDPKAGIEHRGKFLGLAERGTHLAGRPDIATGLDHFAELGVTHVQLLPIEDFDNVETSDQYNWGYMPSHFNTPDGWYATEIDGTARITEFKRLVQAMHEAGVRVVMDVVYNHTDNSASFDKVVPNYYYRLKEDGSFSNGSGCGNEFKSENPMARKFIVDSCRYWAEEYGVDGFRFDLMGLIDIDTMKAVEAAVSAVDPTILVWGEPWTAGDSMVPRPSNHDAVRGTRLAAFNDRIRNQIKGDTRGPSGGFVQTGQGTEELEAQIAGAHHRQAASPAESIQYVSAHDDNVLWDKLQISAPGVSETERRKMQMMCGAILLTSQGKIFLHGGQEMLRTKKMVDNSYDSGDDINGIDWAWKAANHDVFEYHRGLIALRRAHPAFHLTDGGEVDRRLKFLRELPTGKAIAFTLDGRGLEGEAWSQILVIHNADARPLEFALPEGEGGAWKIVVHDGRAGQATLEEAEGKLEVPGRTSSVLWR